MEFLQLVWATISRCRAVRARVGVLEEHLGRPGTCWTPIDAMTLLGLGLAAAHRHEEHLVVVEAQLAIARRAEAVEEAILNIKDNVANCYRSLGRQDEALAIRRAVYARSVALSLPPALLYLRVLNLSSSLQHSRRHAEAKAFLLEQVPKARRALGEVHATYGLEALFDPRSSHLL